MLFSADFYPTSQEAEERLEGYFGAPQEDETEADGSCVVLHTTENIKDEDRQRLLKRTAAVMELIPELDQKLNHEALRWTTRRMGKVELTILRLALYEMEYDESVPEKVAINEAVELAKKFGGSDSPSFVNGILARFAGSAEKPEA